MNVPNKVKHFAWKACRNILATKENLRRRNITKDSICEVCGKQEESTSHLFWFCDHAKEVWSSCKLSFPFEIQPSWDYMDVMWFLQKWEEARPGLLERIVMICWGIWKNRNEARHGGKQQSGQAVSRSSLRLKRAGVGVVIRDEEGQVIAVLYRKLHTQLGPLESKAKAMEVGVKFAREVGIRDVLFEGDSLVLNNAIHGLNEIDPSVQNVVR
ncbi:uncharacterized protein LOC136066441 [Quercus suber]|uniref:uncharacterized protein LOC136066441 n=1 Tax=Quercus suber TaxID=58331 RepID=UPI0032DFBBBD